RIRRISVSFFSHDRGINKPLDLLTFVHRIWSGVAGERQCRETIMPSQPTGDERYAAMARELLRHPGVARPSDEARAKKRFGSNAITIRKKIFAMLVRGRLVVKLPRQRVDELVASGDGERFDPGHGRVMKEWLVVDPASGQSWAALAREAMKFVASGR